MRKKGMAALSLLVFLTACFSGEPKLREKEIKNAVNARLAAAPLCQKAGLAWDHAQFAPDALGAAVVRVEYKNVLGQTVNKKARAQMDVLVRAGLYHAPADEVLLLQPKVKMTNKVYRLTSAGERFFANHKNQICFDSYRFKALQYHTQPTTNAGRHISYVTYTVGPKGKSWQQEFFALGEAEGGLGFAKEKEITSVFYLTNQGWKILKSGWEE